MAAEMTTEAKITQLAQLSRKYKAGVRQLVESGDVAAEELDDLVADAELELEQADEVKSQRRRVKALARTF